MNLSSVYADSVTFTINSNNVVTSTGTYSPAISFGIRYLLSNQSEIAFCFVPKSVLSNNWGADYTGLIVSKEQNNNFTIGATPSSGYGGTYNQLKYSSNGVYVYQSSETNGQFWSASPTISINGISTQLQVFNSLADVCTFYSTNWTTPVNTTSGYTDIESGNIVYFELGSGTNYDIDLESQFYLKSGILSGTWTDDNRRYGFSSELPIANTNFGETAGSGILWTKSTKGQNILGQTKIGDANITGTTTAKYLWIINPMYNNRYFEDNLDAKSLNGLITVTGVPAGTTVYTYKLKQNASSIGLESTIPDVSGGTGTVSETTGTQTTYVSTDDNETPYTQTVGGDNSAPEEVTATEGIRQTLDQLSNSFSTLFLAPVEYIQNLISSGSAFMQTLGGIFSWLPEPVVSVFLSALVLMIVIGVIKMLL